MIANTKRQKLHEHLYAIAVLARHISTFKTNNPNIQQCCFIAGLFHDIGKMEQHFQDWLNKGVKPESDNGVHIESGPFSFENHARHNELSAWTFSVISGSDRSKKREFLKKNGFSVQRPELVEIIKHAVYWHHAKPLRKQDFSNLGSIQKKSIPDAREWFEKFNTLTQQLNLLSSDALSVTLIADHEELSDLIHDTNKEPIPPYKVYNTEHNNVEDYRNDIYYNSCCNIVRSSVICADKIISSLSPGDLTDAIKNSRIQSLFTPETTDIELSVAISNHVKTFFPESDRTHFQRKSAIALSNSENVAALSGAAGCGKTKIALEWALLRQAKKLYWVVPRVSVALGLYNEISSTDYLPDCRVEIFTGEHKLIRHKGIERQTSDSEFLTGHVVITTIDQLVNAISTHRNINIFTDFMLNHAVFDEFHEFINIDAFNLLFAEIVNSKKMQSGYANMLLVSATPHYTFCETLLEIEPECFVEMPSSNTSRYAIEFEEFDDETALDIHPLYRSVPDNSIVISNTATRAQLSYLHNYGSEDSILFHSKIASEDRRALFTSVFDSFKRHGDQQFKVLRSTPIVQASLNITCQQMTTEITTPENMLQRLGRLDRFGEFQTKNLFVVAIPQSVRKGKIVDNEARFLNSLNVFYTTVAWMDYLSNQILSDICLTELYTLYKAFHQSDNYRRIILKDLCSALKQSAQSIECKLSDPLWIKPKKGSSEKLLKKLSLRGDSRYVQMIRAEYKDKKLTLQNEYAFSPDDLATLSISEFDNGDDSALNFMSRKHHQITGEGNKHVNNSIRLKESARSMGSPIFTSYPPADLAELNEVNPPSSLVYVSTDKQIVGCMRLQTIRNSL